jgi:hypothetical protein
MAHSKQYSGAKRGLGIFFAGLCLFLVGLSHAQSKGAAVSRKAATHSASSSSGPVDTALVRKLYMDGDFEQAIDLLEAVMKKKPELNHEDSVFIYKHLGVMYAARYETRERGKMYMHQLLMTEPTAKIMDMYASDMIYMIFKNIQDEFETNRLKLEHAQDLVKGNTETETKEQTKQGQETSKPPKASTESGSHTGLWIGAAVVAAGIGGFFVYLATTGSNSQNHSF